MGSGWVFFIGLILLVGAFLQMAKLRTFSFKNKKVVLKQRMILAVAALGVFILILSFLAML
ncbi:MAG TPA: hypothetical protein VFK44_07185 [Bacillales bacterium]|nr:hypothetical protein [Bacillales bacterium]